MKTILCLTILLEVGVLAQAFACPPCPEKLSLESTIRQADVIVVAERLGHEVDQHDFLGRPDTIKIKLSQVLKGNLATSSVITLYSNWCGGGYVSGHQTMLFLLSQGGPDGSYFPVKWQCSVAQEPVINGRITLQGRSMTLEDFVRHYR